MSEEEQKLLAVNQDEISIDSKKIKKIATNEIDSIERNPLDISQKSLAFIIEEDKKKKEEEEKKNKNIKIKNFLLENKKLADKSVQKAKELIYQLQDLGTNIDICFCIDGTGSMRRVFDNLKTHIVKISTTVENKTGMKCRFGLVVYRDYTDGPLRSEVFDFCASEQLAIYLDGIRTTGGDDECEDCFGGLMAAIKKVTWLAPKRLIMWIGDAPQHGIDYNGGAEDNFPEGDADVNILRHILDGLAHNDIKIIFYKLNSSTDFMIKTMKSYTPYGDWLVEYKIEGDIYKFLTDSIILTVSKTERRTFVKIDESFIVFEKARWSGDMKKWGTKENCILYNFKPLESQQYHVLLDYLWFQPHTDTKLMSIIVAQKPFEKGEFRLAYQAKLLVPNQYTSEIEEKKSILKEYGFKGASNSLENLQSQAIIQAVSRFISKEFNKYVLNKGLELKLIEYVPVSLIYFHERDPQRYFSIEEFIEGTYLKFNGNYGFVDKELENQHPILQTFSHFSFCYSNGLLIITDVQGIIETDKYKLTDPAIHTASKTHLLCDPTNFGVEGISKFFKKHECNKICKDLNLTRPENDDYPDFSRNNFNLLFKLIEGKETKEINEDLLENSSDINLSETNYSISSRSTLL